MTKPKYTKGETVISDCKHCGQAFEWVYSGYNSKWSCTSCQKAKDRASAEARRRKRGVVPVGSSLSRACLDCGQEMLLKTGQCARKRCEYCQEKSQKAGLLIASKKSYDKRIKDPAKYEELGHKTRVYRKVKTLKSQAFDDLIKIMSETPIEKALSAIASRMGQANDEILQLTKEGQTNGHH